MTLNKEIIWGKEKECANLFAWQTNTGPLQTDNHIFQTMKVCIQLTILS